jgi:membrane-bound metal-dependent hydrolase YbcI (DUF457 family)
VPLLFAASVLPDLDLLLRFLMHRGPTHSFITITLLMIPLFIIYRKQTSPYYAASLSHILVGDFFTGGIELLWPISEGWFGGLNISVAGIYSMTAEFVLFLLMMPIMYKLGDLQNLVKNKEKAWTLIIPIGALLGPLLSAGRGQESSIPLLLVLPSLFYIVLFIYCLLAWLKVRLKL